MSREVYLQGPSGIIEGKVQDGMQNGIIDPSAPTVLVLHPDPLAGGTMNNKVSYTIFKAFADTGFNTLRINFRGVGKSKGNINDFIKYPEQSGIADASAALDWLHDQYPSTSHYWIAGFSFGSWIAMHMLMRRPEIEGFISVAPPATNRNFNFVDPCPVSGMFVQPEKDSIAKLEDVDKMVRSLDYSDVEVDYRIVPDADHFFQNWKNPSVNYLNQLYDIVYEFINIRLATRISKPIRKKRRRRKKKDDYDND
ncbi:alpha/beta hydrolase [Candidatus Deianiraea vastatrix]|uniref:Alpha/beta hydrolase family protein n=1 Tax=Candidatus Deianiraea vastatrix TaxID=2163644 RepID=A0A5B8XG10_9RICK|nr:alpha/beta fold hydrolase [Candidatus Deianiraea vastatrix]QED23274.1 Alpha/beta hydrolase family protein [Candidatus Deianiraea vastatrix]